MLCYVPEELQKTPDVIHEAMSMIHEDFPINIKLLIAIDYAYHHNDSDYDGGLSFIDRLFKKLKIYDDQIEAWDIEAIKGNIRYSTDPVNAYEYILCDIVKQENIDIYGL